MIKKLTDHEYSQCHVNIDDMGGIRFISYVTEVVTISPTGWLTCHGLYYPTTRKQIGWFMREYCRPLTFHDAKRCYCDNIYTGLIRKVETA